MIDIYGHSHEHLHSACPVCGYATRFKQYRTRCACNRGCSKRRVRGAGWLTTMNHQDKAMRGWIGEPESQRISIPGEERKWRIMMGNGQFHQEDKDRLARLRR